MKRKILHFTVGLVSLGILWQLASMWNPSFFPQPLEVLETTYEISFEGDVGGKTAIDHLRATLVRIAIITAIALVLSVVVGIAMGAISSIEGPMSNALPFFMAFPPLIVILFLMALLGFDDRTIIIAIVVSTAPYGIVNVWKGTKDVDPKLLKMASVFGSSQRSVWRNIYFPSVLPYLFSTGRYLFSMIWKLTLLAEVFGVSVGIGAQVRFWFDQANLTLLFAYFVLFFVTMAIIEYGVIAQLEKRAFRWRPEPETTV